MLNLLQVGLSVGRQPTGSIISDELVMTLLKALFILAALIYVVFSLVVVRQIYVMRNTLFTSLSGVIRIFGYIQLGLAVAVLIGFIILL